MRRSLVLGVSFRRLPWVMLLFLALLVPGSPAVAHDLAQDGLPSVSTPPPPLPLPMN